MLIILMHRSCRECQKQVQRKYIDGILERAGQDIHAMEKTAENGFK